MQRQNALVFFCIGQACLVLFLKRFDSFADSKWTLVIFESILVAISLFWYLFAEGEVEERPQPPRPKERKEPPVEKIVVDEEKKALEEAVGRLEETEIFLRERLESEEGEKQEVREKLRNLEEDFVKEQNIRKHGCQAIRKLSFELARLTYQIEQERREHAIELRALLRNDDPLLKMKKSCVVPKVAMTPLPAVLLMLATCQKSRERPGEWPSAEHRLLVRRKFFDVIKKHQTSPFAALSLDTSSDSFVSQKLDVSSKDLFEVVSSYREDILRLENFEPFFLEDDRLEGEWTAFRLTWKNLQDIVILCADSSQPQQAQEKN